MREFVGVHTQRAAARDRHGADRSRTHQRADPAGLPRTGRCRRRGVPARRHRGGHPVSAATRSSPPATTSPNCGPWTGRGRDRRSWCVGAATRRGGGDPQADRRRRHRLRAGRRAEPGAGRRLAGLRRQRQARRHRDSGRTGARRRRLADAGPGGGRHGPRNWCSAADSSAPKEALALGLVDELVAPDDVYDAALNWAAPLRRRPGGRGGRGQGADRRRIWTAVPRFSATARFLSRRRAVRLPCMTTMDVASPELCRGPHATAEQVEAALAGLQAGPGPLPRLGGRDLRRQMVDLLRQALRGLCPRLVRRHRARRRDAASCPTTGRWNWAAAAGSSC